MLSLKKIKSRSSVLKRVARHNAYLGTNIINTTSTEIDELNEYSETPSIQIIKYSNGTYAISIYNNNVGYKSITIKNISFDLKILSSDYYYYNYIRYEFINPDTSIKELLKNPELFTENTGVIPVYISNTNNFYSIS